ncbi:hypothetical protein LTR16_009707, partial [Cryomyces antarcticus]
MSLSQVRRSRKESVLSRRQIEGLIADGRKIIVVDGKVLKVDAWLRFHPGGDKAIMHMVGRDATDEVDAYAYSSSSSVLTTADSSQWQSALGRSTATYGPVPDWKNRGE